LGKKLFKALIYRLTIGLKNSLPHLLEVQLKHVERIIAGGKFVRMRAAMAYLPCSIISKFVFFGIYNLQNLNAVLAFTALILINEDFFSPFHPIL